jgi:hypothetical protein
VTVDRRKKINLRSKERKEERKRTLRAILHQGLVESAEVLELRFGEEVRRADDGFVFGVGAEVACDEKRMSVRRQRSFREKRGIETPARTRNDTVLAVALIVNVVAAEHEASLVAVDDAVVKSEKEVRVSLIAEPGGEAVRWIERGMRKEERRGVADEESRKERRGRGRRIKEEGQRRQSRFLTIERCGSERTSYR